jgi:peptide/nickel transport system permease protein
MLIAAPTRRHLRLSDFGRLPRSILVGGVLVLCVLLVATFGDLLAPFPFDQQHYLDTNLPPGGVYRFGTDEFGRDVFSRVLIGSRVSLAYGIGASVLSLMIGVPLGLWAGYKGGRADEVLMRVLDLMMSIPPLLLGLLVLAVTPPALWKTILAIAVITAPSAARIVRSVALGLKGEEFVQAARARGESDQYTVFREILPNAWPAIIVEAGLRVTFGILLGAALSFLGLGAQPPSSDWGLMISEGRASVTIAPWVSIFPGLAMLVTVIGFNLLGGGLRDALDPRLAHDYLH